MKATNKHHVLQRPLVVHSTGYASETGILPKGTSLRYVESFPEGFDRYVVFVNVERSPLDLKELSPPDLVDPLSALPHTKAEGEHAVMTAEELRTMLHGLGVKKSDLAALLTIYD
jgi:hypothetical protein